MIVTDKEYYMERKLVDKLDLLCERCTLPNKSDNLLLFDGDEGSGKSNTSIEVAYYMAWKTGRKFDVDDVYFDIETLINEAIKEDSYDRIFLWDEAALKGLASDWQNQWQKKLVKMLMVARKRRHIYIFNIPKFFKLNEYLVLDRSIGLIHTYFAKGTKPGYYVYYNKAKKEYLYNQYRKTKKRAYKNFFSFRGRSTLYNLPKIINELNYEDKKDEAIMSLDKGTDLGSTRKAYLMGMLDRIYRADIEKGNKQTQLYYAELLGISKNTISRYLIELKHNSLEKVPTGPIPNSNNYNNSNNQNDGEGSEDNI